MHCLTLNDLLTATAEKTGWPWTAETPSLPDTMPDGAPWPRISIVTPSLNRGGYIEETIRSVLLQGYQNLEFIVIDGGSTDGSVEIIEKYSPWLAHWVSEPDRGQGHAINKGMAAATGEIFAYINSDDIYLPGALHAVAAGFRKRPEVDLVHGGCRIMDQEGQSTGERWGDIETIDQILNLWEVWWGRRNFVQPEVFWTRRIAEMVGPFREDLYFVMDYDYWMRILAAGGQVSRVDRLLAAFRITPDQKSRESERVAEELLGLVTAPLWDPSTPIPGRLRWRLQGMWLYQVRFLPEVSRSVQAGEAKAKRWTRLLGCVARHPRILLAPGVYRRLVSVVAGWGRAAS